MSFTVKDRENDLVKPAIQGVVGILEASAKSPSVKRVVITSSTGAVIDPAKTKHTYTAQDFSPITYAQAIDPASNGGVAYRGSKVAAEKAAWAFAAKPGLAFDLTVLCPGMIFGPYVNPHASPADFCLSGEVLWKALAGGPGAALPPLNTDVWIDVRDLAELHVLALETPAAGGKRYLPLAPERYTYARAADYVRAAVPEWPAERVGVGAQSEHADISYDLSELVRDFPGVGYTSFKDSTLDFFRQAVELEKAAASS